MLPSQILSATLLTDPGKMTSSSEGSMRAQSLGCVQVFVTPRSVARQAPLSMGFSRQEYCSVLPFPSPVREELFTIVHLLLRLASFNSLLRKHPLLSVFQVDKILAFPDHGENITPRFKFLYALRCRKRMKIDFSIGITSPHMIYL